MLSELEEEEQGQMEEEKEEGQMEEDEERKRHLIETTYYGPQGYTSPKKLLELLNLKHFPEEFTEQEIRDVLNQQVIHQQHQRQRKITQFLHFKATGPNEFHQADLIAMPLTKQKNKYILNVIDVYSRFCSTIALKRKTAAQLAEAFAEIYEGEDDNPMTFPEKLNVDDGGEFKGACKRYLEENGVKISAKAVPKTHVSIVERSNFTLERPLFKYMHSVELVIGKEFNDWDNILDAITETYNQTYHRTIKATPYEVMVGSVVPAMILNPKKKKCRTIRKKRKNKFRIGEKVRVSTSDPKEAFGGRAVDKGFSDKIYIIEGIDFNNEDEEDLNDLPITYRVYGIDYPLYEEELLSVNKGQQLPPLEVVPEYLKRSTPKPKHGAIKRSQKASSAATSSRTRTKGGRRIGAPNPYYRDYLPW